MTGWPKGTSRAAGRGRAARALRRAAALSFGLGWAAAAGCSLVAGLDDFEVVTGVVGDPCADAAGCSNGLCVDGVCCESACDDVCHACDVVGSVGACVPVPSGRPDDDCPQGAVCDVNSLCKLSNGVSCISEAQCLSGHCVDGVCCDTRCDAECSSCAMDPGFCATIPLGGADDGCAPPVYACDGLMACKLGANQQCEFNFDCASGVCQGAPGTRICIGP